jgi:hypothetical protein
MLYLLTAVVYVPLCTVFHRDAFRLCAHSPEHWPLHFKHTGDDDGDGGVQLLQLPRRISTPLFDKPTARSTLTTLKTRSFGNSGSNDGHSKSARGTCEGANGRGGQTISCGSSVSQFGNCVRKPLGLLMRWPRRSQETSTSIDSSLQRERGAVEAGASNTAKSKLRRSKDLSYPPPKTTRAKVTEDSQTRDLELLE